MLHAFKTSWHHARQICLGMYGDLVVLDDENKLYDFRNFAKEKGQLSRNMRKPTMWILTRSTTKQAVQPLEMARGLKYCIQEVEVFYYPSSEKKALISFAVNGKLICVFVFANADCWFSHDVAHLVSLDGEKKLFRFQKVCKR